MHIQYTQDYDLYPSYISRVDIAVMREYNIPSYLKHVNAIRCS